ncbi:MAG: RpiB/LacA/LacB family sugar-phosphate isomerase, partial [Chloroflexi bacterium]|nr:RpiB/LacA/LacB family sugar-phosphate isomerase [Chloroflexota bacterium]
MIAEGGTLTVPHGARLTPLAQELILERKIKLQMIQPTRGSPNHPDTVVIGADHGGFALKESLKGYLGELGFQVVDIGTNSADSVDYPDFAFSVAEMVG